jgi:hypothetical protein
MKTSNISIPIFFMWIKGRLGKYKPELHITQAVYVNSLGMSLGFYGHIEPHIKYVNKKE